MATTTTIAILSGLTGGFLALVWLSGFDPAVLSPLGLALTYFCPPHYAQPSWTGPATAPQRRPPPPSSRPLRLKLQQVLYHGAHDESDLFLQHSVSPSQSGAVEVQSDAERAGEYGLHAVPAPRIPYPVSHVDDFLRYLARQQLLASPTETPLALDEAGGPDVYATAATNLAFNNVPFRYHYHVYAARQATSFWRSPAAASLAKAAVTEPTARRPSAPRLPPLVHPDVDDPATVLALAKMASNAYVLPADALWYDLRKDQWVRNDSFGWGSDGLRGHLFADDTNSTVVIAIKGTSSFLWWNDWETSARDRLNDNRLFSCCCARVDYSWSTVCDCFQGHQKCGQQCVEDSLDKEDLYFQAAANLFLYAHSQYPRANLWLVGHSLGGSLAGLMGLTYGHPVVAFEAPPERRAAQRLHLPVGPAVSMDDLPVWHFGHNADPLFTGECQGFASSCYFSGYAMETKCHSGRTCTFDTIKEKDWGLALGNHQIERVIEEVLQDPELKWPACRYDSNCTDCEAWTYV
ncbi:putative lipase atg15 [Tieghemiomyces parasiticus]|uniref:triacylglycerol lipase n=1 Tax=Tieghemiomyces parasiticus TaxID=78921 RepID=A0A9W8A392_9FUNG|nr:putative lipase atg15 [Tieghemiomyces parasiticus]